MIVIIIYINTLDCCSNLISFCPFVTREPLSRYRSRSITAPASPTRPDPIARRTRAALKLPNAPTVPHGDHSRLPANVFYRQPFHSKGVLGPGPAHTVSPLSLQRKHATEDRKRTTSESPSARDDRDQKAVQLVLRTLLT